MTGADTGDYRVYIHTYSGIGARGLEEELESADLPHYTNIRTIFLVSSYFGLTLYYIVQHVGMEEFGGERYRPAGIVSDEILNCGLARIDFCQKNLSQIVQNNLGQKNFKKNLAYQ